MKYLILFVLVFNMFLIACSTTDTIRLSSDSYPAKSENCDIAVITQKPDKQFKELVLLEINGSGWGRNELQDFMPDIKEKSCLAGGDAVIIKSSRNIGRAMIHATVIKFSKAKE